MIYFEEEKACKLLPPASLFWQVVEREEADVNAVVNCPSD